MPILLHHPLDPSSRLLRLMLSEYGAAHDLETASPYKRDKALTDINPAATVPLILVDGLPPVIGTLASVHYVEDVLAPGPVLGLIPPVGPERSEMWRLFDWIMVKFNDEVSRYVLEEKIGKRELKQGAPDPSALRAAKANLAEHMGYFSYLLALRDWLAGDDLSLADFALAAHLSALDYLGDVAWDDFSDIKTWFQRIKSRPAFRPLLGDRVAGTPPAKSYVDLDF